MLIKEEITKVNILLRWGRKGSMIPMDTTAVLESGGKDMGALPSLKRISCEKTLSSLPLPSVLHSSLLGL